MQGLQRNAMAMRQEREKEQRVGSLSQMLSQLAASGETPASLRQMGQALVSSQMPEFMTKGMTLIQRAGELEQALRQQERDEASMARILGEETSSGVSVPAAPAGGVAPAASVAPSAAPAVAQNAMAPSAPAANAMLPELRQSDMIQGGAAGTATTSAVGRGVGAPMLTQFMPPMPPRTEYDEATARIDAMRRSISLQITRAQDPGLTEQERLQAREIATLQSTELQKAQQTIGNYLANMGEADLPGGLIEPAQVPVRLQMPPELAPAAAPQPEPAPVVTPRASAAAGTQVAGPMVAGAAPDANQTEINRLEARRERVRTGDLSAARKKDEIAEIDRKLGILRGGDKDQVRSRMRAIGLPETREGFSEYFRMSQPQLGVAEQRLELDRQRMDIDRRRFEVAQAKNEADARAAQRNLSLAERKYELSIRHFELQSDPEYQARIAAARTTANETAKSDVAALREGPSAIEQGKTAMSVLDRMVGNPEGKGAERNPHPGFQGVVGMTWTPGMRLVPGTPEADFDAMLEQVRGGAFLEAYERLRGAAGITEIEGVKGTQAITRMGRSISEAEFMKAADEFRTALKTALDRANKRLTEARSKTQARAPAGAGTQPPAAPAPGVDRNNPLLK
jgi:hypothetical protein